MDRYRADNFLKQIAGEYKRYGGIDDRTIYSALITFGTRNKGDKAYRPEAWAHLEQYYAGNKDIHLYEWEGRCFLSFDDTIPMRKGEEAHFPLAAYSDSHIKIYIPLDNEHVELGVKKIMDFIIGNRMPHTSKISMKERTDGVVVRLIHPQDAQKLINFIFYDDYIQQGLMKCNPFTYEVCGVSLASDGMLSYNDTVAKYIKLYLDYKNTLGQIDSVNIDDFINYVIKYYNSVFIDKKNAAQRISKDLDDDRGFNAKRAADYQSITEMIIKSSSPDYSFSDYLEQYNKMRHGRSYRAQEFVEDMERKQQFFGADRIIIDAILESYNKYNIRQAAYAIAFLLNNNSYDAFSRGHRSELQNCVSREYLYNFLIRNNVIITYGSTGFIVDEVSLARLINVNGKGSK